MLKFLTPIVDWLARAMAILGGVALVALIVMTVVSILGRNFTPWGPVQGDFELVEAGVAFAIFAFMPWCQLNRGHATVEILAHRFGDRLNGLIDLVADLLLLVTWVYLAWRHFLGTVDKMTYNETTFILQFPVWWGYAAALAGLAVIILTSVFCVLRSWHYLVAGKRPSTEGAVH